MAQIIANLTLDTYRKNHIPPLVVPQGDYGARSIQVNITNHGIPVTVESTASVSIVATRSADGESQEYSGSVNADGSVTVPIVQWMLEYVEEVTCNVEVTGTGYQYSTTSFLIDPQEKANPTKISEDDPQKDVIAEVLANENARQAAEATRVSNETARKSAENARQSAETQRLTDEATRVANESARVSAESSRDATFKGWAQDIASLPSFDARISANADRITNLESGIPSSLWAVDETVARVKDVPTNARPRAIISKIGGMTRKCTNLIPFPYYFESKTINGITFTINSNGSVTISGTATNNADIILANSISLQATTYTLTGLGSAFIGLDAFTSNTWVKTIAVSTGTDKTFTIAASDISAYRINLYLRVSANTTINTTIYPMLNEGDTALPYEPYFEGLRDAKVTGIKSVGVNLIKELGVKPHSKSSSGLTLTVNEDFSVTLNGTLTNNKWMMLNLTTADNNIWNEATAKSIPEDYCTMSAEHISGTMSNSNSTLITAAFFDASHNQRLCSIDVAEVATTTHKVCKFNSLYLSTPTGSTFNNYTFKVLLQKGNTATPITDPSESILPIPPAVQSLDGWGLGIPGTEYYNFVDWRPEEGITQFVKPLEEKVFTGTESMTAYASTDEYFRVIGTWADDCISNAPTLCSHFPTLTTLVNGVTQTSFYMGAGTQKASFCIAWDFFTTETTDTERIATFKAWLQAQYNAGTPVKILCPLIDVPEPTDISDLLLADNLISVEGGGTITFENEYGYDVPNTVTYMLKEETA